MRLGGVTIPHDHHLAGHSDADVLLHAVTDALLGALGLGDIGEWFPDTDPANRNRDSAEMLSAVWRRAVEEGYGLGNLDCTVFAQRPKLGAFKRSIAARLAELLETPVERINVKAKTGEHVGPVGRGEAMDAHCAVLLESLAPNGGEE